MEIDHLFVCVRAGAPEAELLARSGFGEGQPNTHPGQGTSCRRFFFRNAYLELLWVHDESEARGEAVAPARLWERCHYRRTGYSPFGVCLRPGPGEGAHAPPFRTWEYRPAYLPPSLRIDVAESSALPAEPLLFVMSAGMRPDRYPAGREQPLEHAAGVREITGVTVAVPAQSLSPALEAVGRSGLARFVPGVDHLMELTFDGADRGGLLDCRPDAPLVLRW